MRGAGVRQARAAGALSNDSSLCKVALIGSGEEG